MTHHTANAARAAGLWAIIFGIFVALTGNAQHSPELPHPRADVLSVGGSVTEIVAALGQQHRLKARDTTSSYPPDVLNLPDVGYMRALSPEGVLWVGPSLILAEEGAGPPEALEVIRAAGMGLIEVPEARSADGILRRI